MWTRKELKDKARGSFKTNYWKSVLVALVATVIAAGASAAFSMTSTSGAMAVPFTVGYVLFALAILLVSLVLVAGAVALYVFVFSPAEVGAKRFFVTNLNQRASVKELGYAYDKNYKETVKTMFFRTLFISLWSLLFVVPGIYKAYEYRMIPYLLADDPTMTKDRAFAESKRMMDGQKWKAFVLDLSFLGWHILSGCTAGILGLLYVGPYQQQTNAALYEKLRYEAPAPVAAPKAAPKHEAPKREASAPVAQTAALPPVVPFAAVDYDQRKSESVEIEQSVEAEENAVAEQSVDFEESVEAEISAEAVENAAAEETAEAKTEESLEVVGSAEAKESAESEENSEAESNAEASTESVENTSSDSPEA